MYSYPLLALVSSAPTSALLASDIRVFKHEFITIFRYSHSTSVHPSEIRVLEAVPELGAVYEEEKGTVFLAREVMERMQKLVAASRPAFGARRHAQQYQQAYGAGVARSPRTRMTMARVH